MGEEIFNSISHGCGTLLAAAALVLLVVFAYLYGDIWGVVSAAIYGSTLIILYVMSTLYHAFQSERLKGLFRIFDHCSIFLLIAGTFTPYTLVMLRGPLGWTLFGIVWGVAVLGIVYNSINIEKYKLVSLICYIVMSAAILFSIQPLSMHVSKECVILLLAGGVVYVLGAIFYVMKKYKYMHSIWHLFVLGGSILHFFSILFYVLPIKR